jgi:aminoglycoside phosphotransferase (APT) family kinase protein
VIAALDGTVDTDAVTAAWDAALQAAAWNGPPLWLHGDLQAGNLLAVDGRLSAVIDFGSLSVGDPACDLMFAWNLFSAETRDDFRAALRVDDATWARGRGLALSVGLIALPLLPEHQTRTRRNSPIHDRRSPRLITAHDTNDEPEWTSFTALQGDVVHKRSI